MSSKIEKDIFRNRKGFCLNWIRMFFEIKMDMV